ncbi:tetratricopeptide repeat protein [Bradyrhizobium sp. SYSU BS000235]|uniref:tetratricopeptide repeat protein n=1 Tax=Bradyrhizobium sp. SYSU BS000235 TaxID=3411332 RepID=UPI003C74668E
MSGLAIGQISFKQIFSAVVLSAFIEAPVLDRAFPAGSDTPAPPASGTKSDSSKGSKSQKRDKKSSLDDPAFIAGYRAAYATIYDHHDYAAAIPQLRALNQDDRADVANLIGYSYRKLGQYDQSQEWYERALKADPKHVRTWQYYGLWQVEQGNRERAEYHLKKIEELAGKDNEDYRNLAAALASGTPGSAY